MANKKIANYLKNITEGNAINFSAFLKLLPQVLADDVKENAIIEIAKGNKSLVTIPSLSINNRIKELTIAARNRIEASEQGNSHQVKTSTSYFFTYHENSQSINPDTVVINNDGINCPFTPKKQALIIENSELFFARQSLFDKMNQVFGLNLSFNNTDLIYGSGNQITNKFNKDFFEGYQSVLCFFDYDLGGLKIFKAMKNMLSDKAQFLEPPIDVFDRGFVKQPKSLSQYNKALESAQELGLMQLHSLLKSERKFMEQEVILALK